MKMGIEVPVPKVVKRDLAETEMFVYDQYILIQAKPRIQESVRHQMRQMTD